MIAAVDPRSAAVQALGWALVHFLWQGALAAGVLASLHVVLRPRSPGVRYLLASATLVAMLALPVATFVAVRGDLTRGAPDMLASEPSSPTAALAVASSIAAIPVGAQSALVRDRLAALLPGLVLAWGAGVALLSARYLGGWTVAQRLKRSGQPAVSSGLEEAFARLRRQMRLSRPVRLCESVLVEVPTVIGWLRPVILIPAATLAGLTPAQAELILAHELAHIRRFDYLVNLFQSAVETLLFYHPAVWWVSNRMRVEREHCCDDMAVAACGDVVSYARALTDLETLRAALPAPAMAATGGSLVQRIARLVGGARSDATRSSRWLSGLVALGVVGLAVSTGASLRGDSEMLSRAPLTLLNGGIETHEASPVRRSGPTSEPPTGALPSGEPPSGDPPAEEPPSGDPPSGQPPSGDPPSEEPPAEEPPAEEPPSEDPPKRAEGSSRRTDPSIQKVLELMQAGVNPEYVEGMAAAGYDSLGWDELIELRQHGVGPEFVRGMAEVGYSKLSPERLMNLRSHGVSPEFVQGLKANGLEGLSLSDLLELRSSGVSPDFVAELKKAGLGGQSVTGLLSLRSQGVTPAYITELASLGHTRLSASRLIALRSQGVNPRYIRELKELGYTDLSVPVLMGLRSHGVTPDYVRGMKARGYAGLPAGMLIELRNHGVTPEYVLELQEAGYKGLSPEELIELRSRGVKPDFLKRMKAALEKLGGSR